MMSYLEMEYKELKFENGGLRREIDDIDREIERLQALRLQKKNEINKNLKRMNRVIDLMPDEED